MSTSCGSRFWQRMIRRKHIHEDDLHKTNLERCLSIIDLTALGIGSTLGAGAYVISGQVAKADAGPAVILSFFIAAVASVLAGLCYAEFGARVPKAGSAYIYTYVTVGELIAFIIGWNLILEYMIGAASVARTSSGYVDNLIGSGTLINWFEEVMPMDVKGLAPYFDLFALSITMVLTIILAVGVRESATFTKLFTALNLCILSYVIIAGAFKDDPNNWKATQQQVTDSGANCGTGQTCGSGGFFPYGLKGVTKGAATCFFAFVGFDAIATTGEEAKNPQRAIPIATVASLLVVFLFYTGISVTITMMAPYYLLDSNAPFSVIFENVGWTVSVYIVGIGAICALATSLLGAMFPLPRVVFAMSRDGIIFRFLARVNPRLKTPVIATLISGSVAAVLAALFDTEALVNMMSIGTLLAYTLVSASVLLLRFEADRFYDHDKANSAKGGADSRSAFTRIFRPNANYPTKFSYELVKILVILLALFLICLSLVLHFDSDKVFDGDVTAVVLCVLFLLLSIGTVVIISLQPQNPKKLMFMVPAVPYFPALSMLFNIFLIVNLDIWTFVRFAIWMVLGFAIYFGYGMFHSNEELESKGHKQSDESSDAQPSSTYDYAVDKHEEANVRIPPQFGVHPSQADLLKDSDSRMSQSQSEISEMAEIVNHEAEPNGKTSAYF